MNLRQPLRLFVSALKLSRVNNLIIIFLTQYLAAIFLMGDQISAVDILQDYRFFGLVMSTVIIAASGYYINDYYDIKIDLINKPHKVIVGKDIKRRPVMFAHVALNSIGVLLGVWVSLWIGLINLMAVFFLWLYSNQLKRMPFLGNFVVALLTSATLMTICVYFRTSAFLVFTFAFFAFGINLIREIIKDIEDVQGDASFGSNSLPVVLGIRKTKWIIYGLTILYLASLVLFLYMLHHYFLSMYFMVLSVPFLHFLYLLSKADTKKQFTFLSKYCKWIILAGILSMTFLKL